MIPNSVFTWHHGGRIGTVVYSKTIKRRPCWCSKQIPWELISFLMQTLSFVLINLHRCRPREWKRSISNFKNNKSELWKNDSLTSFQKLQLQSVSIFFNFFHPFLLLYLLTWVSPTFHVLIDYDYTQVCGGSLCFNVDKFRNTAPFKKTTCKKS